MCALQATGTDWICFCRSSFLLLHDMFLHFSIYPTFVPFETAIVSSKIRKGNTPIIIYRRKHYETKRTFRSEYVEGILRTHFNRHA